MSLWSRPGDDGLTASDRLIRDLKREGLPDAEIAARVGISIGDVKKRLEQLSQSPAQPAAKPSKRSSDPERGRPVAAAAPGAIELGWFGDKLARHGKRIIGAAIVLALGAFIAGYYARGGGAREPDTSIIRSDSGVHSPGFSYMASSIPASPGEGITAIGTATRRAPADLAYIIYPALTAPPSEVSVQELVVQLRILGIAPGSVILEPIPELAGQWVFGVSIPADSLAEIGDDTVAAVRSVPVSNTFGQPLQVHFGLSNCDEVMSSLWIEAITDAHADAERIAAATGQALGPVIAVEDALASDSRYIVPGGRCPGSPADFAFFGGPTASADVPAEVGLSASLVVTFALGAQSYGGGTLTVQTEASVTAGAESAFVAVVFPEPIPTESDEWQTLVGALSRRGVESGKVSVGIVEQSSQSIVRVELDPTTVSAQATEILDLLIAAVSQVRVPEGKGVFYTSSQCDRLDEEAYRLALDRATRQATEMVKGFESTIVGLKEVRVGYQWGGGCLSGPEDPNAYPTDLATPAEVTSSAALAVTFAVEPE